jgi:glycosyltransferase involved in cell wall biosynthesis
MADVQVVSESPGPDALIPDEADTGQSLLIAPNVGVPSLLGATTPPSEVVGGGARAAPTLAQMGVRVSVVIPTLNEAQNLPHVFAHLPEGLHEVIVVDGRSTDRTVAVARRLRPDARIVMQTGRGKGNALAAGFRTCTGDIVVTLDADGSADASEIPRFVAALCYGADFVKGSRFAQGGASSDITHVRKMGNRALSALVNALYGTAYTDLCYGYNAFWARCLPYLRVDCDGFEVETLINVRIAKAGLVVHEVPSNERNRIYGMSNLSAVRDGSRVLRTIALERVSAAWRPTWRARLRRRPPAR